MNPWKERTKSGAIMGQEKQKEIRSHQIEHPKIYKCDHGNMKEVIAFMIRSLANKNTKMRLKIDFRDVANKQTQKHKKRNNRNPLK